MARLSPWHRTGDVVRLVNPLAGLTAWRPPPGAVGVVAVLLGSTAFDSFTNTSLVAADRAVLAPCRALLWATAGLLVMIVLVLVTFTAAAAWMGRYGDRPGRAYARLMAGSLVPIVVGYAVAHYFTLLVVEGQRVAINLSDPLGPRLGRLRHRRAGPSTRRSSTTRRRSRSSSCSRSSSGTSSASSPPTRRRWPCCRPARPYGASGRCSC